MHTLTRVGLLQLPKGDWVFIVGHADKPLWDEYVIASGKRASLEQAIAAAQKVSHGDVAYYSRLECE